jgi:hypothetical protein
LVILRNFRLRRWRRNVFTGLVNFLKKEHGETWHEKLAKKHPDLEAGRSCV